MVNIAKYDRQDAIREATFLFWEKGFHATSMRNIQERIDMRPGSIYATFGSKEELFKETLQYYADMSLSALLAYRTESASPLDAFKRFMSSIVLSGCNGAPSEMCMLVKTVSEMTEDNAELLLEAKRLLKVIEEAFASLLTEAQQLGEINAEYDVYRLARFLQMQLIGLRVYSRANSDTLQVSELIDDVFTCFN